MADNLYFSTSTADNLDAMAAEVDQTAATPNHVKSMHLYKDTNSREIKVGTMPIIPPETVRLDLDTGHGENIFIIPEGYHNGKGKVYTGKLSEYTPGTAKPEDVVANKIFWSNGNRLIGTLNLEIENQIGTATAEDIVAPATAWVNKNKITGTIPRLPRKDKTLLSGESYTIPYGLSAGTTVISAATLSSQTPGNVKPEDIIEGKTAWSNGDKVKGTLNIDDTIRKKFSDTDATQMNVLQGKKFYSSKMGQVVSGRMVDHSGEPTREIAIGQPFTIPEGYYNGFTKVQTKSLRDATIGSAKPEHILNGKISWTNGEKVVGTMPSIAPISKELKGGEKYNIPMGFHDGHGFLICTGGGSEDTPGTAKSDDLIEGKTAWVKGNKITGTMKVNEAVESEIGIGTTYFIPKGYHTGAGSVKTKTLAEATPGDVEASSIKFGKIAWANGDKVVGNMPIVSPNTIELGAGEIFTIPKGFHEGTGKIKVASIADMTVGTASSDDILEGKVSWVNGDKVVGTLALSGTANSDDVLEGKSFYNVNAKVKQNGTLKLNGTATEDDVFEGVSFYSDNPKRKRIGSMKLSGTVTPDKVVMGETFYTTDPKVKLKGTMPNLGGIIASVTTDTPFNIPKGFHDGTGKVTCAPLDIQTKGTATPEDIAIGKTAWVNGGKITGSMALDGNVTPDKVLYGFTYYADNPRQKLTGTMITEPSKVISLNCDEEYTIPKAYHDGTGKVVVTSLASQTDATAVSEDIRIGKTAWVKGNKVIGTMPEQSIKAVRIEAGKNITIPAGYYPNDVIIYGLYSGERLDLTATDAVYNKESLYPNTSAHYNNEQLVVTAKTIIT